MADETATMGRPSAFQLEYVEQVEKLARLGATMEEIGDFFEVSRQTVHAWGGKHPEFLDALKRGRAASDMEVAENLYKRSIGWEWTEQQAVKLKTVEYGDNGRRLKEEERVEIVEVVKTAPPDVTAMIFWLKNRRREDWRDSKDMNVRRDPIEAMSDDELKRNITKALRDLGLAPAANAAGGEEAGEPKSAGELSPLQ